MAIALGITLTIVGGILAGLVTAGGAIRRVIGISIATILLMIPFGMKMKGLPPAPYQVSLTVAFIVALRAIDLASEQPSRPARRRVLHIFVPFDSRLASRCRPHIDMRQVLRTAAWAVTGYVALRAAAASPDSSLAAHYFVRWLCGIVWVMALFETLAHLISLSSAMVGFHIPTLHDAPYKSSSLREFWTNRWNRLIGQWLREHCYLPLARRGSRRLGLLAAFAASAAMHLYITSVLLNLQWGVIMASLFLLQIPLLQAEDFLHIRQRSGLVGRIWTLGVVTLLSPLFTEPVLRIFHA